MNELLLYEIVRVILKASKVMEGRFIVAEGSGNDLNTNNFNDIVKDALSNYKPIGKKIPVSVMMPPLQIIDSYEGGWSRFKIEHFFLCATGYTGSSELKGMNISSNTAEHSIQYDWKDMTEVAICFRKQFNLSIRNSGYLHRLNSATNAKDYIRRVSNMGNDKLTGVRLSYELNLAIPCTIDDYENSAPIILPDIDDMIHLLHQH